MIAIGKELRLTVSPQPGIIRTSNATLAATQEQLQVAAKYAGTSKVEDSMRLTGVKDPLAAPLIQRLLRAGIDKRKKIAGTPELSSAQVDAIVAEMLKDGLSRDPVNPLITHKGKRRDTVVTSYPLKQVTIGLEIHKDTPTEILHTILLGVIKYFWGQTMFLLDKKAPLFELFRTRLNSLEEAGLEVPKIPADYMCKHKGSLIGKHFKSLVQVMPFIVHDLVPADLLEAWKSLGRLTVLLWVTDIPDLEAYLVS